VNAIDQLIRDFERHRTEETPIGSYATGDFSESTDVQVQGSTARYLVLSNTGNVAHTLTANPRAPGQESVPLPVLAKNILNVPLAPFTDLSLDSTDASVFWFFSDEPLLFGNAGAAA